MFPVGAMITGMAISWPSTVVRRSRRGWNTAARGRRRISENAARLRANEVAGIADLEALDERLRKAPASEVFGVVARSRIFDSIARIVLNVEA